MTDNASAFDTVDDGAASAPGTAPATLVQKLSAEALGTFVLVFLGCGSVVTATKGLGLGGEAFGLAYTAVGLTFGLVIVMMAYAFGRISGGHFNPAVSVGAAVSGRMAWRECGLYAAAQTAGALVGGLVLALVAVSADFGWEFGDPLGSNGYGDDSAWLGALLLEVVLTAIFLFVILGVTDDRNETANFAPLAIGLSLTAIHFVGIPVTGTSVNPARSIGVAPFSGSDAMIELWLFIVAPLLGGALAGLAYPLLFGRASAPVPGSGITLPSASASGTSTGSAAGAAQTEYPGWKWDAQAQQWVADPATAPAAQTGQTSAAQTGQSAQTEYPGWKWDAEAQQWVADPGTTASDATQIRPGDA